jgi:hypothetical protein
LRIEAALAREIERIAKRRGTSDSEAARMLLALGVDADRKIEAAWLRRPYDADDSAMIAVLDVHIERFDPEEHL